MTVPDRLSELLARVEAASGKLDDEALGRLLCATAGVQFGGTSTGTGDDGSDDFSVWSRDDQWSFNGYRHRMPDVSLDAALALVERVLPGWGYDITYRAAWGNHTAAVIANDRHAKPFVSAGKSAALALLAALLRALTQQTDGADQ